MVRPTNIGRPSQLVGVGTSAGSGGGGGAIPPGLVIAVNVSYDNSTSGLSATDLQAAIDELTGLIGSGSTAPFDHGSMGSTETIDLADGTWHRGVLTADLTETVQGFTVGQAAVLIFGVTQDGTGGWGITHDADIVFAGDDQPAQTAGDVTWFAYWSDEGDPTIYGAIIGGGSGGGASALDDLTDVVITAPAENDTLRYVGGVVVNDNRRWEPVTFNFGTGPELVWDGDDLVMEWKAY